jgi:hypothetical protein
MTMSTLPLAAVPPFRRRAIGTQEAYQNYRDILAKPIQQPDDVAPDYKTQADAPLYGDPYDFNSVDEPNSLAEYFRDDY